MTTGAAIDRFAFLDRQRFRWALGALLVLVAVVNTAPRTVADLVYFLWSCDLVAIVLGVGLIANRRSVVPFATIIVFSGAIDFALDFVLMIFGFPGPRAEWMRQVQHGTELVTSISLHFLLIAVTTVYCLHEARRLARDPVWRHVTVLAVAYLFAAALIFPVFLLTRSEDNINYVFRSWTGEVRTLAGLAVYFLGYVFRGAVSALGIYVVAKLVGTRGEAAP